MSRMPARWVVLFSREPRREAREKGLLGRAGERLFAAFAEGWSDAARRVGARLVIATPPEDRGAWRARLSTLHAVRLSQRGRSFGERLEDSLRRAAFLGGRAVVVGGDAAPDIESLSEAFTHLEGGADAVLAPARDGGVSLIGLAAADLDLLRAVAPRRRDVYTGLCARLAARGRRVERLRFVADVDGRRELSRLLRALPASSIALRAVVRHALRRKAPPRTRPRGLSLLPARTKPSRLRAPPLAA